jgi:hypothetical protein
VKMSYAFVEGGKVFSNVDESWIKVIHGQNLQSSES